MSGEPEVQIVHERLRRKRRSLLGTVLRYLGFALLPGLPALGQEPPSIALPAPDGSFSTAFTSVSSIRELPNGNVLLADRREGRLYHLDWDEDHADAIGRRGEGPGEYQATGWIYPLASDSSLFTEGRLGRWHILEGARIVRTIASDRPLPSLLGGELGGGDGTGRLIGLATYRGGGPMRDRYAADSLLALVVRDLTDDGRAGRMDTVAVVPGRGPGFPTSVRRDLNNPARIDPLVTETLTVLFTDGWVALVVPDPYAIRWRSPEGEWRGGEPIEGSPQPLSEAVACAAVRGWDFRTLPESCTQEDLDAFRWPERTPPFLSQGPSTMNASAASSAHAAPDGRLLVRRLPSPERLMENRYDVIDREGRLAGILRLPANQAIVGAGGSHIYVAATDDLDLQFLSRHPWP